MKKLLTFSMATAMAVQSVGLMGCAGPVGIERVESLLDKPTGTVNATTTANALSAHKNGERANSFGSTGVPGMSAKLDRSTQALKVADAKPKASKLVPMNIYLQRGGIPKAFVEHVMTSLPVTANYGVRKNTWSNPKAASKGGWVTHRQNQFSAPTGMPSPGDMPNPGSMPKDMPNPGNMPTDMGALSQCIQAEGGAERGSMTIDLGCTKQGSGKIRTSYRTEQRDDQTTLSMDVAFLQACIDQAGCINGTMLSRVWLSASSSATKSPAAQEASGTTGAAPSIPGLSGASVSSRIVSSFLVTLTPPQGEPIVLKQAMRAELDVKGADGAMKVDYLLFVPDEKGVEQSLVLQFALDSKSESAAFSVRGANGSFSCKASFENQGQCEADQGGESFTW